MKDYLLCYRRGIFTTGLMVATGIALIPTIIAGAESKGRLTGVVPDSVGVFATILSCQLLLALVWWRIVKPRWKLFSRPRHIILFEEVDQYLRTIKYVRAHPWMDVRELVYAVYFVYEEDMIQTKLAV